MEALTHKGRATYTMFKVICDESYERAIKWFKENPDQPYCYWARDEFIRIADKHNKNILERHPEIEDINDHTIVSIIGDTVILTEFCPKLREGIHDFLAAGYSGYTSNRCHWIVEVCGDNYMLTAKPN